MRTTLQKVTSALLLVLLVASPAFSLAAEQPPTPDPASVPGAAQPPEAKAATLSSEQLEQLLAPIALYPDSLLAQVLMASTYPLEVVSASRWAKANSSLKGKSLDAALQKQPWDPSVKSLVAFPQVLQMMNDKLDWTEQLGNAFLAQQKDCMDAVQRLRAKAQAQGSLVTTKQQIVKTQPSGSGARTIIIQPAQPDVIYVPTYNPTVVYGVWPYPAYPPYAWYPPGYVATTSLLSFGVGLATGYALWGDMDWGHYDVDVDVHNYNHWDGGGHPPPPPPPPHGGGPGPHGGLPPRPGGDGGRQLWQHDPAHRKGVPYHNPAVERQFRGNADTLRNQERSQARQAFRGHGGASPFSGHAGPPGQGAHMQRPRGMDRHTGSGIGGGGRHDLPRGGGLFQDMNRGGAAHFDAERGARSNAIKRDFQGGGAFHGGGGSHGGGGFHGGGGGGFHGGGRFRR